MSVHVGKTVFLLVGQATYYQVGPNARLVTVEPNPNYDRGVARRLITAGTFTVFEPEITERRMEQVDYDPLEYMKRRAQTLRASEQLEVGENPWSVSGAKITSLSRDLIVTPW